MSQFKSIDITEVAYQQTVVTLTNKQELYLHHNRLTNDLQLALKQLPNVIDTHFIGHDRISVKTESLYTWDDISNTILRFTSNGDVQ